MMWILLETKKGEHNRVLPFLGMLVNTYRGQ